jgi:putative NADH-flavin reductase
MKVALLGATGFVGSALLKEALDRGHVVTAIVRHPKRLEKREGLAAKAGDVYATASLATLIREKEAIISAFSPGWKNPNLYDDQVRGTASIIAAIKKAGIKRVLWVHEPSCGLAVVLPRGRRIEVHPDFDTITFERLLGILERA